MPLTDDAVARKVPVDDPRFFDLLERICGDLRAMIEGGNVLAKNLYAPGPGVSRSTISRLMDRQQPTPEDMSLSTLFYMVDRMPMECRLVIVGELCREWGLRVTAAEPVRTIDVNNDGRHDVGDVAIAAKRVDEVVSQIIAAAIDTIARGEPTADERALQQKLRVELQGCSDTLVDLLTQIAAERVRKQCRPLPFPGKVGGV